MTSTELTKGSLSTIDFVILVAGTPERSMDFALVLHLKRAPSLEALQRGARSARNLYPTTGSHIKNYHWRRFTEPADGVEVAAATGDENSATAIEAFLKTPFDPHTQMPVRQLVVRSESGRVRIISRFHHTAADGLSAAMWLAHQLGVARGEISSTTDANVFHALAINTHPSPVKRSRYAFDRGSDRLWTSGPGSSGHRRWVTIDIPMSDLRRRCARLGGFSYNDLLATCALETFSLWNREHCGSREQRVSLWLPVNIRSKACADFGNGSSRVRLYATDARPASLSEKCREIRQQISWSMDHGEWSVPTGTRLSRLPPAAKATLLRWYLHRPGVDMATGVFSHVDRLPPFEHDAWDDLEKVECIGQLHARHSLSINGFTRSGQTWLTFTYDPGLLSFEDVQRIQEIYQDQIAQARRELV